MSIGAFVTALSSAVAVFRVLALADASFVTAFTRLVTAVPRDDPVLRNLVMFL